MTVTELRERLGEVLGRVQCGHERVSITRYGEEVAAVVSVDDARLLEQLEDLLDTHDALAVIEEADRTGTISLDELRKKLGR